MREGGGMKITTTAYNGQVGEPKTTYVLQLEAENAALRARVEELELQVSLLTPSYVEYQITGSDHTRAIMTDEECTAIFGWQCQRCGRTCYEEHCPCEFDGEGVA